MDPVIPHILHISDELWEELSRHLGDLRALGGPEAEGVSVPPGADAAVEDVVRLATRFAAAATEFVLRRPGLGGAGGRLLTLGLACARASADVEQTDAFLRALGTWDARCDTHLAERYFQQALLAAKSTNDLAEQGIILSVYGELQRTRTQLEDALRLLEEALAIHEALDNQRMQAITRRSLGEVYWCMSRFKTAREHYDRALDVFCRLKDRSGEGDMLNKIGSLAFNRGKHLQAIRYFERALPIHREVGNRSMEGEDLNDMGIAHVYLKQHERAIPLLEEANRIHRELGNRRLQAIATVNLAAAHYLGGDFERAVRIAQEGATLAREVESVFTEMWSLNWQALGYQDSGRPELALPLLERAEQVLRGIASPRELAGTLGNLGYLLCEYLGRRAEGRALLQEAADLMRQSEATQAFGGRTLVEFEALLKEFAEPS
jgi:tetratricopeptide (TPR) repeat protein